MKGKITTTEKDSGSKLQAKPQKITSPASPRSRFSPRPTASSPPQMKIQKKNLKETKEIQAKNLIRHTSAFNSYEINSPRMAAEQREKLAKYDT